MEDMKTNKNNIKQVLCQGFIISIGIGLLIYFGFKWNDLPD